MQSAVEQREALVVPTPSRDSVDRRFPTAWQLLQGYYPVSVLVFILVPILIALPYVETIPARKLDFELYDARINKPRALVEHVPMLVVWYSGIMFSVIIIPLAEFFHPTSSHRGPIVRFIRCSIAFTFFLTAINMAFLGKEVTKRWVGKLRPDFLDRCQPDPAVLAEPIRLLAKYNDSICLNPVKLDISDGRTAFPSGHSTVASAVSVFLAVYFIVSYKINVGRTVRAHVAYKLSTLVLGLVCVAWAWYVAACAQVDNRHAAEDTLGGLLLGGLISVIMVFHAVLTVDNFNTGVMHLEMELAESEPLTFP